MGPSKLATAYMEIRADDKRLGRDLQKVRGKTTSALGSIAKTASGMLVAMLVSKVAGALKDLAVSSIAAASRAQEIESKFGAVFKHLTKDAEDMVADFRKRWGFATSDLRDYMSTFQDTFVPLGFARDKALELSQSLVELGVDLGSFYNMDPGAAMHRLTSALVGNHESVRSFGIVITEASLKAKLLEMGIKGGTKAATEQQKVMARLKIIMGSTKDAQGDMDRTSSSAANQMRVLSSQIQEIKEELGEAFLPIVTQLIGVFIEEFVPALLEVANVLKDVLPDAIKTAQIGFRGLQLYVTEAVLAVVHGLNEIRGLKEKLLGGGSSSAGEPDFMKIYEEELAHKVREIGKGIKHLKKEGGPGGIQPPSEAVADGLSDIAESAREAAEAVKKLKEAMKEESDRVRKSLDGPMEEFLQRRKHLERLRFFGPGSGGITEATFEKGMEHARERLRQAMGVDADSLLTPMGRLRKRREDLEKLRDVGALSPKQFEKAYAGAVGEWTRETGFDKVGPHADRKTASGGFFSTTGLGESIQRALLGSHDDYQQQTARNTGEIAQRSKEMADAMKSIDGKIENVGTLTD